MLDLGKFLYGRPPTLIDFSVFKKDNNDISLLLAYRGFEDSYHKREITLNKLFFSCKDEVFGEGR